MRSACLCPCRRVKETGLHEVSFCWHCLFQRRRLHATVHFAVSIVCVIVKERKRQFCVSLSCSWHCLCPCHRVKETVLHEVSFRWHCLCPWRRLHATVHFAVSIVCVIVKERKRQFCVSLSCSWHCLCHCQREKETVLCEFILQLALLVSLSKRERDSSVWVYLAVGIACVIVKERKRQFCVSLSCSWHCLCPWRRLHATVHFAVSIVCVIVKERKRQFCVSLSCSWHCLCQYHVLSWRCAVVRTLNSND